MTDALLADMPEQRRSVLALEATRRLVSGLHAYEAYVDARLVEVPCEEALQFYCSPARVFHRIYGHVDALVFRLEEVKGRDYSANALQAAFHATLAACRDVHAYHVARDGGDGPSYDCYFAESSQEDAWLAVQHACDADRQLVALLRRTNAVPLLDWLHRAAEELRRPDTGVADWIMSQPPVDVPYPFRARRR
jgi:hypothetical protein